MTCGWKDQAHKVKIKKKNTDNVEKRIFFLVQKINFIRLFDTELMSFSSLFDNTVDVCFSQRYEPLLTLPNNSSQVYYYKNY